MIQGHADDLYSVEDSYEQIAVGMILPVILLVILFVIRQAKYNAIRVHQFLPYKKRFGVFLTFWGILFMISSLPMAVYFGSWFTPGLNHSSSDFQQDFAVLENNYVHFKIKRCFGNFTESEQVIEGNYDDFKTEPFVCDYRLKANEDSLILLRYNWGYFNYYNGSPTVISVPQALEEIEEFIKVARKYGALIKVDDPRVILDNNLSGEETDWIYEESGAMYNRVSNAERFETNINVNQAYKQHRNVFVMFNGEFWRYYSLVGFTLAFLLIIFCSVERAEFGWSMLVCALMPTAYGIILGLLALLDILDGEGGARVLLFLFVAGAVFMAFGNFRPRLKRIFGISLNIFLPLVLPIIFMGDDFDEDAYVVFSFLLGLGLTALFTSYYKMQYLHPRKT